MPSITGANATFLLAIATLFPAPQQLQGFAADDVFGSDPIDSTEFLMGVDGFMSSGFVFVPVRMSVHLQADSPSNFIFDTWYSAQQVARDVFPASATVLLTAIGTKYTLQNGVLTSYKPTSDAKKLLQPRTHTITWNSISPAPS